ncbi:L-ascorbate metabolism protein UlaG (beta-lactamase superfamily) [Sinorhizobium kostiense]|uniref:L-ascorbate metabolism protein UlaG (Beta-lactamase superfamily) n=1 Tax=Sinorhizobium kostiense TaxID=76747 RepID=A0ABS4R623_9HYPH|nr:MBL fold metallo-hydrolase [Sinorhizobium kostiense]MBP2237765.1 L-ascorbate metabolism protein UlaG (beta-lactamase superfamily) [Sinorhizobium kostiense]
MRKEVNPYYSGPVSDHFDGIRFFNPGGIAPRGLADLVRWQFGARRMRWPARYDSPFRPSKPDLAVDGERLRVTMVGHATLLIQVAGRNILSDPVWSRRASPFAFAGPPRRNAPGIRMADLPPIDLVLVTHNHYDHLDLATLGALHAEHAPHMVTPLGNDTIIRRAVPEARISVVDWGDRLDLDDGFVIHAEPCHHWSARRTSDRRMALWAAFVIETPAGKIYHVGDTGFHGGSNYRAAREKHGPFRLANLPFGCYEPRWFMEGQHQNPEEAVMGMLACGAGHVAGHHWGTFRLTNEGIEDPLRALEAALDKAGIERDRFRALRPGEVFDVPHAPPA